MRSRTRARVFIGGLRRQFDKIPIILPFYIRSTQKQQHSNKDRPDGRSDRGWKTGGKLGVCGWVGGWVAPTRDKQTLTSLYEVIAALN